MRQRDKLIAIFEYSILGGITVGVQKPKLQHHCHRDGLIILKGGTTLHDI